MISVKIISTPAAIERLRAGGPAILAALTEKMNELMVRLQQKIVGEAIPGMFPSGAPNIAGSITLEPAHVEGSKIIGGVTGGGPRTRTETKGGPNAGRVLDYARIQEEGVPHSWMIQPVLYSSAWAVSQKKRVLGPGLPQALAFLAEGKLVIVRSVLHPPLPSRPFMRQPLHDMEAEIVEGLSARFKEVFDATA